MSGFIYIWFDKKHKRFYIGSHWGSEDDGYICSSTWMRNAYKRRPEDFRRRIVKRVDSNRNALLIEEHRWLQMIGDRELGKKFYNLTNHLNGHWFASDEDRVLTIKEKMKKAWIKRKERGPVHSPETRKRLSEAAIRRNARPPSFKGKMLSDSAKKKISDARKGKPLSIEHCEKLRIASTGQSRASKLWRCTYVDGRIIESKGRDSFGIPVITIKRLAKSGKGSPKHGILKIEKV